MFHYFIKNISIESIRSFKNFQINFDNRPSILFGKNGIGKTSILESISLIYPGHGLRGGNYINILNNKSEKNFWKIDIVINDGEFDNKIQSLYENNKKTIKINDKKVKNFNEILDYCRIFGVTQDDYHNILNSGSSRRKFFDRMISQFFSDYYNNLVKYNYYLGEKNKIFLSCVDGLSESKNLWLDELDKKLSKLNFIIGNFRKDFIEKFNEISRNQEENKDFLPMMEMSCELKNYTSEDEIFCKLKEDRKFLKKNFGIHISKFNIFNINKISIDFLSSGEQRLILNRVMINFIRMQILFNNIKPILLLDDILTFFDKKNQSSLIDEIRKLDSQCFITTNYLDVENHNDFNIINLEELL